MTGRAKRGRGSFGPQSRGTTEKPASINPQVPQQTSQPIVSKYLQSLCRVCGRPCRDGVDAENEHAITSMLFKHLHIKVVHGDGLPHQICQTCSSLLMDWDCAVTICQAFQLHLNSLTNRSTDIENRMPVNTMATLQNSETVNTSTLQHTEVEGRIPEDVNMATLQHSEVESRIPEDVNMATLQTLEVEGRIPEDVNMTTLKNPEVEDRIPEDVNMTIQQHPVLENRMPDLENGNMATLQNSKVKTSMPENVNVATLLHNEIESEIPEDVNMATQQHTEVETRIPDNVNMATQQLPGVENRTPKKDKATQQHSEVENRIHENVNMTSQQHSGVENRIPEKNMATQPHSEIVNRIPENVNRATLPHLKVENREQQAGCKKIKLENGLVATLIHPKTEKAMFQAVVFPEVQVCLGVRCDAPVITPAISPVNTPTITPVVQQVQAEEVDPMNHIGMKLETSETDMKESLVEEMDTNDEDNELRISDVRSSADGPLESDQSLSDEICILSDTDDDIHDETGAPSDTDKANESSNDVHDETDVPLNSDEARLVVDTLTKKDKNNDPDFQPDDIVPSSDTSSEEIVKKTPRMKPRDRIRPIVQNITDLKDMCIFCGEVTENLLEHLRAMHKTEERVKMFRINLYLFNNLRKDGNFMHNMKVLTEKQGSYLPSSTPYQKPTGRVYPCGFCFEFLQKATIHQHTKHCKYKPTRLRNEAIQRQKYLPMMVPIQIETKLEMKVATTMFGSVKDTILNDPVLLELGKQLKAGGLTYKTVFTELSAIASVLSSIQSENQNINSIEKLLTDPNNGALIFEATSKLTQQKTTPISTYDNEINSYTVCENIKNCLFVLLGRYVHSQDSENIKMIKQFLHVFCLKWDSKISKLQEDAPELHSELRLQTKPDANEVPSAVDNSNLKVEARKLRTRDKERRVLSTCFDDSPPGKYIILKCLYCNEELTDRRMRHYYQKHKSEPRVQEIMKYPPSSTERRLYIKKLANEVQFRNNLRYLETQNRMLDVVGTPKTAQERSYLPCEYCLTFIPSIELYTHVRSCRLKKLALHEKSRVLGECEMLAQKMVQDYVKARRKRRVDQNCSATEPIPSTSADTSD